jgi:diadenosine tetraphosphatase ApaH/serine/threonine PP2A family protein phosphatase
MVYLILSDIHGNLEALKAVIGSFPDAKDIKVLCAGDVVGYGANPNECIDLVESLGAINVMGNHDAAVIDRLGTEDFNKYAQEAVDWTRKRLGAAQALYLGGLSMSRELDDITIAHGTLHEPERFGYMLTGADAMRSFELLTSKVCFVGHSHIPDIFILRGGKVFGTSKRPIKLSDGEKYIVNAGSVGQPRDGDPRACYCVYDTLSEEIEFKRVEYDIGSSGRAIIKAGLPGYLAERLRRGK